LAANRREDERGAAQFSLQRSAYFATFSDVRMIVASMALLAGIPASPAQEQEAKLVDRILKPNMSLVNSAQNKQFGATEFSVAKRASSPNFSTPERSVEKSFAGGRAFSSKEFAVRHSRAGDTAANISTKSQPVKTDMVYVASAADGARVASESGRSMAVASFAGNRPFLGQGKSQKALSARDTPLTIEQVRELLNKNK
jgi:hypothetical protein